MKISILTPVFNGAGSLERAIQSVLAQNDPDCEHIVVDGGSKDGTVALLKKYPQVKWISEPDRGQCDAMNKAFALSRGEVVTYLNADDWFEAGAFAHVRELFAGDPGIEMVIGNLYIRYADKRAVRLVSPTKTYRGVLQAFRYDFPYNPVSYFYRRAVQERVGAFPLHLHYTMDYWFLLRALRQSRIEATGVVLGTFFVTGQNKTLHNHTKDTCWQVATTHLREENPKLRPWFYAQWLMHRAPWDLLEKLKQPGRRLAYRALFARVLSFEEYGALGFRGAYRKRFARANPPS